MTCSGIVSAQESAREMLGIVKNRDFSKLFMKSTIRKNRLAELAKAKRLNRHFLDIVEKAKWMQEMKANNLFGDESPTSATPCITEISLRDLCTQIDFDALKSQNLDLEIPEEGEGDDDLEEFNSDSEDDPDTENKCTFFLQEPANIARSNRSSLSSTKRLSDASMTKRLSDASSAKRTSVSSSIRSKRTSSVCQENIPDIYVNSDNFINEYTEMFPKKRKNSTLSNGNLHFANNYTITDCRPLYDDINEEETSLLNHKSPSMPSKSRYYNNTKKRKSWQESSLDDSDICYDDITKDDLLLMWKASEMELNNRLQKALREKSRLQRLLVDLDTSQEPTPV